VVLTTDSDYFLYLCGVGIAFLYLIYLGEFGASKGWHGWQISMFVLKLVCCLVLRIEQFQLNMSHVTFFALFSLLCSGVSPTGGGGGGGGM
jgi:hypothetical protein